MIASRRGVHGPEEISEHLWREARHDVSAESVFEYMHGYDYPEAAVMVAFKEAFGLTRAERDALAVAYAYGDPPSHPY